jgi:hypothetical protein
LELEFIFLHFLDSKIALLSNGAGGKLASKLEAFELKVVPFQVVSQGMLVTAETRSMDDGPSMRGYGYFGFFRMDLSYLRDIPAAEVEMPQLLPAKEMEGRCENFLLSNVECSEETIPGSWLLRCLPIWGVNPTVMVTSFNCSLAS